MNRGTAFFKRKPPLGFSGTVVVFILIEGLFSFCSKTTCPAFADAAYDSWFPYQAAQTVYFTATSGDKDTLSISNIYRSPEHKEYGRSVSCNAWASVSSYVTPTTPRLYVNYDTSPVGSSLTLQLNDFNLNGANVSDQQITAPSGLYSSMPLTNFSIAGKNFSNGVLLQRDTATIKTAGIYKVWLTRGTGLVGYEFYPTGEQWAKD